VSPRHAAFYGSLRRAIYDPAAPPLGALARFLGPCTLRGRLVDHAPYPGFFPDPDGGAAAADLLEIRDARFFEVFDDWEDYHPGAPERSMYIRRVVPLADPPGEAWVYISNQSPRDQPVPHGDWCRYVRKPGR